MIYLDISSGDPFDLPVQTMPPRSRLFSLQPMGAGTPHQESLISLIVRTAYAHSVNPRELIGKVFPEVEPAISELAYSTFFTRNAGTLNGLGRYTKLFVSAMEKLTGRTQLRHMTMLPWEDLLTHNGPGLIAKPRRWCPECLLQQRLGQEVAATPLIWSLEVVKICLTHHRYFENECPHCGRRQPHIPRYPDLAVCDYCHQFLAIDAAAPNKPEGEQPNRQEYWIAKSVGDMLAGKPVEGVLLTNITSFREFVQETVVTTGGNRAALSKFVGFRGEYLNGLFNKNDRPSMGYILKVLYGIRVVLAGSRSLAREPGLNRLTPLVIKKRPAGPRLTHEQRAELEILLRAKLVTPECLPVTVIAASLGLSSGCLRYWFPEICGQLTIRYQENSKLKAAERMAKRCQRVAEIVRGLRGPAGEYPSLQKIRAVLAKEGLYLLQPQFYKAYCTARDEGKVDET